jgi:hypothetical protein
MDSTVTPSAEALPLRLLRIAALAILALALAFFIAMEVAVLWEPVRGLFAALMSLPFSGGQFRDMAEGTVAAILIAPVLIVAAGILFLAWALRLTSWKVVGVGAVAVTGVLVYLATDDATFEKTTPFIEPAQATREARDSFAVLMRYGREHPEGKAFKEPTFKDPYPDWNSSDEAKWRAMLTSRRAELEAHWAQLAPQWAWWNEMNAFDRIGDLTPPDPESEIIGFQVFRTLSHHAFAIAGLQAIDGHGDQAVETLLPVLEVSLKLRKDARILVRSMIAVVIERLSLESAAFILDTTPVSPAERARLADALRVDDPTGGARALLEKDYAFAQASLASRRAGDFIHYYNGRDKHAWMRTAFNVVSPFIYNPKATFNLYGRLAGDLQDLVGRRELDKMDPRSQKFFAEDAKPRFKNLFGRLMIRSMVPAYFKVSENYWRTEDMRVALLARLKAQ